MVLDPMPAEDLLILLDLIEPALDDWRLKRRIVQRIGAIVGGDWFGAPEAAPLVGKSRGWCRDVLAKLDDDRVIIRYGTDANGRKIWCEVNPDWERWRGVPWLEDRHAIRRELAYVRQRRQEDAWDRFIAFSGASHPRCAQLARVVGGRKRDVVPNGTTNGDHRVLLGTENAVTGYRGPASRFEPWDHPRSESKGRGSDPQENAMIAAADRLYTLFSERSKDLSSSRDQERKTSQQQSTGAPRVDDVHRVAEAIHRKTGYSVFGELRKQRIPEVVGIWGAEQILETIARTPAGGLSAPQYLTLIETEMHAVRHRAEAARVDALHRELATLKQGLAELQYLGEEPDPVDDRRHKELCQQLVQPPDLPLFAPPAERVLDAGDQQLVQRATTVTDRVASGWRDDDQVDAVLQARQRLADQLSRDRGPGPSTPGDGDQDNENAEPPL